ncbi:MAG TPA: cytochrome c [Polyangia bacterium]|jgi:cytochrome c556|nr:cytochrome c [Polyangia bacterium]
METKNRPYLLGFVAGLLIIVMAVAIGVHNASARPTEAQRHLPTPEHLPSAARSILKKRMERHGRDMGELMWAVLLLDYDTTQKLAQQVATEPLLARPLAGDASELNSLLPERFFTLQDELKSNAATLARVAPQRDPEAMADAYGRLAHTCVACHQTYLHEPGPRRE